MNKNNNRKASHFKLHTYSVYIHRAQFRMGEIAHEKSPDKRKSFPGVFCDFFLLLQIRTKIHLKLNFTTIHSLSYISTLQNESGNKKCSTFTREKNKKQKQQPSNRERVHITVSSLILILLFKWNGFYYHWILFLSHRLYFVLCSIFWLSTATNRMWLHLTKIIA